MPTSNHLGNEDNNIANKISPSIFIIYITNHPAMKTDLNSPVSIDVLRLMPMLSSYLSKLAVM
jgi:hypothetical protein